VENLDRLFPNKLSLTFPLGIFPLIIISAAGRIRRPLSETTVPRRWELSEFV
jgi:hypothetical protein